MTDRKSEFLSELNMKDTIHPRYIQLLSPLGFYSSLLKTEIWVPTDFVCDKESVPVIEGTSIRGGVFHDYLSRYDSFPCVEKFIAADVYLEVMKTRDKQAVTHFNYGIIKQFKMAFRRDLKYTVVRWWPGYFHKLPVKATLEQILIINHRL
ncbi:MAG: hypothetical protein PHD05_00545 [Sphaerochaetaceae bacterium]|nr:hypothetical protein [Sphaerochaetaceae bacterium]